MNAIHGYYIIFAMANKVFCVKNQTIANDEKLKPGTMQLSPHSAWSFRRRFFVSADESAGYFHK